MGKFEKGVLRRQRRATGLSESAQKSVILLKSTFKLEKHLFAQIIEAVSQICSMLLVFISY